MIKNYSTILQLLDKVKWYKFYEGSYYNIVIVLLIYNLGLLREVKINQITDYVIYLPIPKNFLILIHGPCG